MNKLKLEDIRPGMRFKPAAFTRIDEVLFVEDDDIWVRYRAVDNYSRVEVRDLIHINEMTYLGPSTDPIPQRGWVKCVEDYEDIFEKGNTYKFFGFSLTKPGVKYILVSCDFDEVEDVLLKYFKIIDPTKDEK